MLKEEFENRVSAQKEKDFHISKEDYRIIENVYNYYPGIDKEAAAKLYIDFGLIIFKDMTARADIIADIEDQIRIKRNEISDLTDKLDRIAGGKS